MITKFVNVATPFTAATVVVPDKVPVPEAIDATTFTVEEVTVVPFASTIRTTGCVPSTDPLAAPAGCVVIAAPEASPFMYRITTIPEPPEPASAVLFESETAPAPPPPVLAVPLQAVVQAPVHVDFEVPPPPEPPARPASPAQADPPPAYVLPVMALTFPSPPYPGPSVSPASLAPPPPAPFPAPAGFPPAKPCPAIPKPPLF